MIALLNYKLQREGLTQQLNEFLLPIQQELKLAEEGTLLYNIRLAVWEVLCNVIEHSINNADNLVDLVATWTDETLTITITDYGDGFDWQGSLVEEVPDATQLGGRGLLMAKMFCEKFTFNSNGEKATLVFNINRKEGESV